MATRTDKPHKGAYIVLVSGKLKEGQAKLFVELFSPLAQYVADNEPGCLCYELSISDSDPDRLIIFERYTSKEYLETVHWQSEAFHKFRGAVQAAQIEWVDKAVTKYVEADVGFM